MSKEPTKTTEPAAPEEGRFHGYSKEQIARIKAEEAPPAKPAPVKDEDEADEHQKRK
jgi:hypothetical protein